MQSQILGTWAFQIQTKQSLKIPIFLICDFRICFIRDYTLKSLRLKASNNFIIMIITITIIIFIISRLTTITIFIIMMMMKAEKWEKMCAPEDAKLFFAEFLDRCLPPCHQ